MDRVRDICGPHRRRTQFSPNLRGIRRGGEVSDRQWSDVQGVMELRDQDLDIGYLRQWAPELGVADLLERALTEARK